MILVQSSGIFQDFFAKLHILLEGSGEGTLSTFEAKQTHPLRRLASLLSFFILQSGRASNQIAKQATSSRTFKMNQNGSNCFKNQALTILERLDCLTLILQTQSKDMQAVQVRHGLEGQNGSLGSVENAPCLKMRENVPAEWYQRLNVLVPNPMNGPCRRWHTLGDWRLLLTVRI